MRRNLIVALGLLVGASVACLWPGDAAASPAQPPAEPVQPTSVRVPPVAWKTDGWQDAPDKDGQYLLAPSPHASFEIGGRQYVTTLFGVLVRDEPPAGAAAAAAMPGPWKIVPELYRKNFQPVEVRGDLLWVVDAKPRGKPDTPVRVQAMDVKSWEVKQNLELPATAVPVHVEDAGIWFVQPGARVPAGGGGGSGGGRGMGMPPAYGSIALWGLDGKEKLRFSASETAAAASDAARPADTRPLQTGMYWWGFDPDTIWMGTMTFRGGPSNDEMTVRGPSQFVRIDRTSGKRTTVDAPLWPGRLTVNTPQRILWLRMANTPEDKRYYQVMQLDKESQKISQAGRLEDVNFITDVAVDDNYLWVRQLVEDESRARAFSLKDFAEALPAGKPAAKEPFHVLPPGPAGLLLLGGDAHRAWLALDRQIIELPDDGEAMMRQMPLAVMPNPYISPVDTKTGSLYAAVGLQIFCVKTGSDQVLTQEAPGKNMAGGLGLFCLGEGSLWASAYYELLAYSDGMVLERRMQAPQMTAWTVVNKALFYFGRGTDSGLYKLDLAGGEPVPVRSWDKQVLEWYKNTFKVDPSPAVLKQISSPWWLGTDGTGKVCVLCQKPTDPRLDVKVAPVRTMLWTYDIAKDQWEAKDLWAGYAQTFPNVGPNKAVLFTNIDPWDVNSYRVFSDGHVKPLGPLPKGWLNMSGVEYYSLWRIHVTDKYVYAWTPLGLWRKPRGN